MRTLRRGYKGKDVEAWEYFLRGQDFYWLEVDGFLDDGTWKATKEFQKAHGLNPDGVIGKLTYAAAMQLGFDPLKDDTEGEEGPNWPGKPDFKPLVGNAARGRTFGQFRYKPAGVKGNPEAIRMLDNWAAENMVSVEIPQLQRVKGTRGAKRFQFHRLAAPQVQAFFQAVEDEGLSHLILTWGGSYSPRFIRGSRTTLSNHSFGSAFDINVPWNWLGTQPALVGKEGSVRELVPVGHRFGLYWGGHFKRKDGMHFEVAKVMDEEEIEAAA